MAKERRLTIALVAVVVASALSLVSFSHWIITVPAATKTGIIYRPLHSVQSSQIETELASMKEQIDDMKKRFQDAEKAFLRISGAWAVDLEPYNRLNEGLQAAFEAAKLPVTEGFSGQLSAERKLYVAVAQLPFVKTICEIGFNGGHSAGLWLLANPNANVTMFDIWDHNYAPVGEAFLRGQAANEVGIKNSDLRLKIIKGSSHDTLPLYGVNHPRSCDLISIDGDHSFDGALRDLIDVLPLARDQNTLVFLDDTNCHADWCAGVNSAMFDVVQKGYYEKLLEISEDNNMRGVSLLRPVLR